MKLAYLINRVPFRFLDVPLKKIIALLFLDFISLPNQFYNNKKISKKNMFFGALTETIDKLYEGGLATKVF